MTEKLNDLTSKIKGSFDFIWGMAERSEEGMEGDLGFVLLASGFDDSVMYTEEYAQEIPQPNREEEDLKISDYYGSDLAQGNSYKEYETVIFTDQLLTNNGFISLVNQRPTLTRSREQLETIKQFIEGNPYTADTTASWREEPTSVVTPPTTTKSNNSGGSNTITFGDD